MEFSDNNSLQNDSLVEELSKMKLESPRATDSSVSHIGESSISFSKQNLKMNDFELPNSQLSDKIRKMIEYLLSDAHILKDKFLLKHIKRNNEGYISLKLISSLRKVKAYTKNWKVIAYSLEKSKSLQLNDEKTKVRRIHPIPNAKCHTFDTKKTCILQLSKEFSEVIKVKELLNSFGEIVNITIVKNDSDYNKTLFDNFSLRFVPKYPYAFVEFNSHDDMSKAIHNLSDFKQDCFVIPYLSEKKKEKKSSTKKSSQTQNQNSQDEKENSSESIDIDDAIAVLPQQTDEKCVTPNLKTSRRAKKKDNIKKCSEANEPDKLILSSPLSEKDSKWNQRRALTKIKSVYILRQPRGPDGTIGFHEGRSKANMASPKTSF